MKEVTAHHAGVHSKLSIFSTGDKNEFYRVGYNGRMIQDIVFQVGNPNEVGFNGVTNEALLAIVRDRLIEFQSSEFACVENQQALVHVDEALISLKKRTYDRITRNVEGTHIV